MVCRKEEKNCLESGHEDDTVKRCKIMNVQRRNDRIGSELTLPANSLFKGCLPLEHGEEEFEALADKLSVPESTDPTSPKPYI